MNLTLSVVEYFPLSKVHREGGVITVTGLQKYIMDILAAQVGFNFSYIEPPIPIFGRKLPNGTWIGKIRDLVDGVWAVLSAFMIVVTCELLLNNMIRENSVSDLLPKFGNYIWEVAKIFLLNGDYTESFGHSGRIVVGFFSMATVVVAILMNGVITSNQVVQTKEFTIDSLEHLVKMKHLCVSMPKGTAIDHIFKTGDGFYQDIWRRVVSCKHGLMDHRNMGETDKVLSEVAKKKYAVVTGNTHILFLKSRFCDRHPDVLPYISKNIILSAIETLGFSKKMNPETKGKLMKVIARLYESGIYGYKKEEAWESIDTCNRVLPSEGDSSMDDNMKLDSVINVFKFWALGLTVSSLVFLSELLQTKLSAGKIGIFKHK